MGNAKNAKTAKGTFMTSDEVAKDIVDAALKVHRALGPGLLESAYQACLAHELGRRRHRVECEVALPLAFEGVAIEVGYRYRHANRPVGFGGEQDTRKDSSDSSGPVADLPEIKRPLFGADHQLERDDVTRGHHAGGPKSSGRTGDRAGIKCLAFFAWRAWPSWRFSFPAGPEKVS